MRAAATTSMANSEHGSRGGSSDCCELRAKGYDKDDTRPAARVVAREPTRRAHVRACGMTQRRKKGYNRPFALLLWQPEQMADKESKNKNQWQSRKHVFSDGNEESGIVFDGDEGIASKANGCTPYVKSKRKKYNSYFSRSSIKFFKVLIFMMLNKYIFNKYS
jgi:hypothetical protein